MSERLLTFGELVKELGLPESRVERLWRSGEIPGFIIGGANKGGRLRFRLSEVLVALGAARPATKEFVYFITRGAVVKIGRAKDPDKRLRALQTASDYPLTLVAVVVGGREREKELHERFAHLRVRGEWFGLAPDLHEVIEQAQDEERARAMASASQERAA